MLRTCLSSWFIRRGGSQGDGSVRIPIGSLRAADSAGSFRLLASAGRNNRFDRAKPESGFRKPPGPVVPVWQGGAAERRGDSFVKEPARPPVNPKCCNQIDYFVSRL